MPNYLLPLGNRYKSLVAEPFSLIFLMTNGNIKRNAKKQGILFTNYYLQTL